MALPILRFVLPNSICVCRRKRFVQKHRHMKTVGSSLHVPITFPYHKGNVVYLQHVHSLQSYPYSARDQHIGLADTASHDIPVVSAKHITKIDVEGERPAML